jgi:threonine synthase
VFPPTRLLYRQPGLTTNLCNTKRLQPTRSGTPAAAGSFVAFPACPVRLVTEREMLDAIRLLLLDEHVVAEPAGAAATAAFPQNPSAYADANVVLLISGANVAPEILRRAVL